MLTFHPDEDYFPVDAKRYVESAALWSATYPFSDKGTWSGGPGDPFPRAPLVPAGALAAVRGEAGKYIDDPALRPAGQTSLFLELGGWKDSDEAHVGEVTADSANPYADRAEVVRRYRGDLEASRFWYHAELFPLARLSTLALGVGGLPEVGKALRGLTEPLLLCYYFFFPAHEQSVGTGQCDNIEAKEVGSHAGDWQCVALLLDGDGTKTAASYTPKFLGYTGLRPGPVDPGGTVYRPYQFDDDGNTVMKVEAWDASGRPPLQLTTIGDHPHLYVARGSHSLYTTSGPQTVDPYFPFGEPRNCGRQDTYPIELHNSFSTELQKDLLTLLVKMVLGGLLGSVAWGFIVGMLEASTNQQPFPEPAPADPVPPDSAAAPDGTTGITVRPRDLPIPGVTGQLENWRSAQGFTVGTRTYDVIVDRERQGFWPHDDGVRGYRGRWGQQVAGLDRRGGVRFPSYWKMFLGALEFGKAQGQLDLDG